MKNRLASPLCPILYDNWRGMGISFLRIFAGIMMLIHGIDKITDFQNLAGTFPDPLKIGSELSLLLITIAEFGCALMVVLGLFTRVFVIPLIFGMVVAAFFTFPGFSLEVSELAIMYLIVFISLLILGGGRYSLDSLLKKRFQGRCIN